MSKSQLTAKTRNNSLNPRQLRSSGKLPATLYGKGMDSVSLELDSKEFATTYKKDKNAIFELKVDKEIYSTIVKKVQVKAINDNLLNVEFQHIRADEAIRITVAIKFVGESPAVKAGGDLITNITEMEVECLPADIPSAIEIDLSKLKNLEDTITVADVSYPKGVKPIENSKTFIVKVATPKSLEQLAAEEAAESGETTTQESA